MDSASQRTEAHFLHPYRRPIGSTTSSIGNSQNENMQERPLL